MSENFGKSFKIIRESKNLKLKDVAEDNQVSESQISRFESGKSTVTIDKFFLLLKNMCVTLDEFQSLHENFTMADDYSFHLDLADAYNHKDIERLRHLLKTYEDKSKKFPHKKYYRVNSIVIKAVILDINPKFMIGQEDIEFVTEYLMSIEDWTKYEFWVFGNSVKMFGNSALKLLGADILGRTEFYRNIPQNTRTTLRIILNLIVTWLEQKDFKQALKYLNYLENLKLTSDFLYEKAMIKFYRGYYLYHIGDPDGRKMMKRSIEIFEDLDCFAKADSLSKELEKLR